MGVKPRMMQKGGWPSGFFYRNWESEKKPVYGKVDNFSFRHVEFMGTAVSSLLSGLTHILNTCYLYKTDTEDIQILVHTFPAFEEPRLVYEEAYPCI